MSKDKAYYTNDIVFIGNGDIIERASRVVESPYESIETKTEISRLPVVTPWDAREVITKMMVNYGKDWSNADIDLLKKMRKSGTKQKLMSKVLGRTKSAVHNKIYEMKKKQDEI